MPPAAPPYRIRHLTGLDENVMLGALVMTWRRKRDLPAESARPILDALRDEREIAVLVDTHDNTLIACLELDRTALSTPPWTDDGDTQPTLAIPCAATAPDAEYKLDWLLTIWARHYAALCDYTRVALAVLLHHEHDQARFIHQLVNAWEWRRLGPASAPGGEAIVLTADACRADGFNALIATDLPVLSAVSAEKEDAS